MSSYQLWHKSGEGGIYDNPSYGSTPLSPEVGRRRGGIQRLSCPTLSFNNGPPEVSPISVTQGHAGSADPGRAPGAWIISYIQVSMWPRISRNFTSVTSLADYLFPDRFMRRFGTSRLEPLGGVGGSTCTAQGTEFVTSGRHCGGTSGSCSNPCCSRGLGWRRFRTDIGLSPEGNLSGTKPPSPASAWPTSSRHAPNIFSIGASVWTFPPAPTPPFPP